MSDISFSMVRAESVQFGTIFKYRDRLRDLSLLPGELEAFPWAPAESWPEFLEKRLRPMIYFLHAAVTHDFSLVGPKGHYFPGEKTEILEWLEEVLLHCRLVLLSLFPPVTEFLDDVKIPLPESWEMPGEATAMFGILYRICSSLNFSDIPGLIMPMNKFSLIPLFVEAQKTRLRLRTAGEYFPYDKLGMLEEPESFLHPYGGNVAEPLSRLTSYMRETWPAEPLTE
ncbi:hypothetical protein B0H11DRAFT_2222224 [Mycena galericulata]|nr:hypothetical protein B0H11DRAFT_2222224 [Mycena galericulata]